MLYTRSLRTVVMSPLDNFWVGIHSSGHPGAKLSAGIKQTVEVIPAMFSHSTVLVAGQGINDTLVAWGDVLLCTGGKERVNAYDVFALSHLGFWTDNGVRARPAPCAEISRRPAHQPPTQAYYYHNTGGYANMEAALLAVKAALAEAEIPVQYYQWDDWMSQELDSDDVGGACGAALMAVSLNAVHEAALSRVRDRRADQFSALAVSVPQRPHGLAPVAAIAVHCHVLARQRIPQAVQLGGG